jgi:hypothetical protein
MSTNESVPLWQSHVGRLELHLIYGEHQSRHSMCLKRIRCNTEIFLLADGGSDKYQKSWLPGYVL